jgi:hypothetical protein
VTINFDGVIFQVHDAVVAPIMLKVSSKFLKRKAHFNLQLGSTILLDGRLATHYLTPKTNSLTNLHDQFA